MLRDGHRAAGVSSAGAETMKIDGQMDEMGADVSLRGLSTIRTCPTIRLDRS